MRLVAMNRLEINMEKVVLAKVGDIEVTKEDMIRIMRNMPQQQQQQVAGLEGRKRLLDEMVAGELFYLSGLEKGLDQEEKFQNLLKDATRTLLQQYTLQRALEAVEVTDEDLKVYYEANKSSYLTGATATASHILMADETEILKVKEEIEGGKSFADAAKEYSTCPSKERGGDLGSFERGRMVPEFEEAAFSQDLNVVGDPVQTQFGYHLILVSARGEASQKAFEEVAPQISQELNMQKQAEIYHNEVSALKAKYPVELFEDGLK